VSCPALEILKIWQWCFIRVPGRTNSRRDKLLNETVFVSRAHAQVEIAAWVEDCNRERPQAQLVWMQNSGG
jgi:hypothetical protein